MPVPRKPVTTAAVTETNIVTMMNREFVPKLRELSAMQAQVIISGSRSGATVAILTDLLAALSNAGIITDTTTP